MGPGPKWVASLIVFVFLTLDASAAGSPNLRDETYLRESIEGLRHVYRLEHEEALDFFSGLEDQYPEHPGPPLAHSVTLWLKELFQRQELDLNRFISPGYFTKPSPREMPGTDRRAYFDGMERSRQLAERILERHPGNKDARYYLGAIEGALGAFAFTIDRSYLSALRHGKKAYEYQRAIIEEDPDYDDSYLTVGTYEYIVGNLPWYIKWIATIAGYRGSSERGFQYLIRAAEKGEFVKNDARVLLMVLYVREKEYDYGLAVSEQLHTLYPENFLLHLNRAQILELKGDRSAAAEAYLNVVRFAEDGRPNYDKLPLGTFRYSLGTKLLELDYPGEALRLFQAATDDPRTPMRERALSHLKAGQLLDIRGQREEAITEYEQVHRLRDVENSHERASELLRSPYRP